MLVKSMYSNLLQYPYEAWECPIDFISGQKDTIWHPSWSLNSKKNFWKKCPKVTPRLEKFFFDIKLIIGGPNGVVWYPSWPQNSKKIFLKKCPKVTSRLEKFFFGYDHDNKWTIIYSPWKYWPLIPTRSKGQIYREQL